MFHTKVVAKIKTHFTLNNFFPPENHAVYGIMWKNMAKADRPQVAMKYGACAFHAG
jgi:hypothetical protein